MGIIGSIRKHSWIAVAIVGIAILAFIVGDLTKNGSRMPDVGVVDGKKMNSTRFNSLLTEQENNYKMQTGNAQIPSNVENQLRNQVWNEFVEQTIMDKQYDKLGMSVGEAEVNDMFVGTFIHQYIRQLQGFTNEATGEFDAARMQQLLDQRDDLKENTRAALDSLEDAVVKDRLQQKYSSMINAGFYMPKAFAEEVAEYGKTTKDVRAIRLAFSDVDDNDVTLEESDYKAYYNKHHAEFRVQEEYRNLDFILFPVNPTAEDMKQIETEVMTVWDSLQATPDDEMAFFVNAESDSTYDSSYVAATSFPSPFDELIANATKGTSIAPQIIGNEWMMAKVMDVATRPDSLHASIVFIANNSVSATITRTDDEAKVLADSIYNVLRTGKLDFDQAVEEFSDDKQNADAGWVRDGMFFYELNNKVIETPAGGYFTVKHPNNVGYLVVKVIEKSKPYKKFRVAKVVRAINPSNATHRVVYNEAARFAGENRSLDAMTTAAQKENLSVRNANINVVSTSIAGVDNVRDIVRWAYNEDTKIGEVASQVFESDGYYIVVALKDIYKQGFLTLAQTHDMIEQNVRLEKKAELLIAKADEAIKASQDISSIAVKLGAEIDTINGVTFEDYYLANYGMEPLLQSRIATGNGLIGPVKGTSGVYVVQVDASHSSEAADTETVKRQLEQSYRNKTRSVMPTLRNKTKIVDQRNNIF